MDFNDLMLLFAGGAVGVAMDRSWDTLRKGYTGIRSKLAKRRRKKLANDGRAVRQLGAFYEQQTDFVAPHKASESGQEIVLPLLTRDEWTHRSRLDLTSEALITFDSQAKPTFGSPMNRLGNKLKARGSRIYEGQICYVSNYDSTASPTWTVGVCSYETYASFLLELEAKGASNPHVTRSRRKLFSNPLDTISAGRRPVAVGATVALVDGHVQPYSVLLQRRSDEVIVDAGKLSFVPVFGLEPNATPARRSELGLLQYNMIREFGEELFDIPELVELARSSRINPDWIRTIDPISNLEKAWQGGEVDFYVLGMGIDLLNPSLHIAVAGVSRTPEGWLSLLSEASGNWEIAGARAGVPSIQSVGLESAQLAEYVNDNDMSPTSVFAYDLLRKWAKTNPTLT